MMLSLLLLYVRACERSTADGYGDVVERDDSWRDERPRSPLVAAWKAPVESRGGGGGGGAP